MIFCFPQFPTYIFSFLQMNQERGTKINLGNQGFDAIYIY